MSEISADTCWQTVNECFMHTKWDREGENMQRISIKMIFRLS